MVAVQQRAEAGLAVDAADAPAGTGPFRRRPIRFLQALSIWPLPMLGPRANRAAAFKGC